MHRPNQTISLIVHLLHLPEVIPRYTSHVSELVYPNGSSIQLKGLFDCTTSEGIKNPIGHIVISY